MLASIVLLAALLRALQSAQEPLGFGVCIWERGVPASVVEGFVACDGSSQASYSDAEFTRHSVRHGWSKRGLSDLVEPRRSRHPCPASVVDELARIDIAQFGMGPSRIRNWLADFLAHNDRADEALAILDRDLAAARLQEPLESRFDLGYRHPEASELASWAAHIAALAHRWDRALEYSAAWQSYSTCGTCGASMDAHMKRLRAHWQIERGDFAGARAVLSESGRVAGTGRGIFRAFGDPCSSEMWIESWVREGQDASQVLAYFRESSAAAGDRGIDCARHWEILHMSDDAKLDRIAELDGCHDDVVVPLLLVASPERIESLLTKVSADHLIYGVGPLENALRNCGREEVAALLRREIGREQPSSSRASWLAVTLQGVEETHAWFCGRDGH
jgi:hypothetical protein